MIRLQKDLKNKKKYEKKGQMIGQVTYSILDHSEYKYKFAYRVHSHKMEGDKKSQVDKWIEEKAKFTKKVFSQEL